jgi:hypothetical protein
MCVLVNANRFEEIPPALEQGILESQLLPAKACCKLHTLVRATYSFISEFTAWAFNVSARRGLSLI